MAKVKMIRASDKDAAKIIHVEKYEVDQKLKEGFRLVGVGTKEANATVSKPVEVKPVNKK